MKVKKSENQIPSFVDYSKEQHKSLSFWLDDYSSPTLMPNCTINYFVEKGGSYLLFLNSHNIRGAEKIETKNDLWYSYIKSKIGGTNFKGLSANELYKNLDTIFYAKCYHSKDQIELSVFKIKQVDFDGEIRAPKNEFVNCASGEKSFLLVAWKPTLQLIAVPIKNEFIDFSVYPRMDKLLTVSKIKIDEFLK